MYNCPHCNQETIPGYKKFMSGKSDPAVCLNCGLKSYPDARQAIIGQVAFFLSSLIFIVPAIYLGELWLSGGIFVCAAACFKYWILDKPMIKAG